MHFLLILHFFNLSVSLILIDNVESIDKLFFLLNSKNRYFIKVTVVNLISHFFDILSSGFVTKSLGGTLLHYWNVFSLIFLLPLIQVNFVWLLTICWIFMSIVFWGCFFYMFVRVMWCVEISFFSQDWRLSKFMIGRLMRLILQHGLPYG